MVEISVIIPSHNPDRGRLGRTLTALGQQTLERARWEIVLVDNASTPPIDPRELGPGDSVRLIREPKLGLTSARRRGIDEAEGEILVFVDDDNVLAPDYLEIVRTTFASDAGLGAIGGRSIPEFEASPEPWVREFDGLLALRDLGNIFLRASWPREQAGIRREYPGCAPIGAGMAMRRAAARAYAEALGRDPRRLAFDRTGTALVSGGDNDLTMTILEQGFEVAYVPTLRLTHLIPAGRCSRRYLGALNRAIARSWVQVLSLHDACPWHRIRRGTVRLRQWRAWFRYRAWTDAEHWVRWQGACGHFEGLAMPDSDIRPERRR